MTRKLSFSFILFVWLCSTVSIFSSPTSLKQPLNANIRDQITTLREKGHHSHTTEQYKDAIKCYTAVLQLVEGVPGDDAYELRRRCGLNLAYCNLKDGNYAEAVARCSEVIDESSNFINDKGEIIDMSDMNSQMLRQALATAHKRRGRALQLLGKDDLAEVDFVLAKQFKSKAKTIKRPQSLKKYSEKAEILQEFVEECQAVNPRKILSKTEVTTLTRANQPSSGSFLSAAADPSLFGGSGMGGMDLGSLMGGLGQDLGLSHMIKQFGPMLGLSPQTVSVIANIVDIFGKISSTTKKVTTFFQENKEFLVVGTTILWILYFFRHNLAFDVSVDIRKFLERYLSSWK